MAPSSIIFRKTIKSISITKLIRFFSSSDPPNHIQNPLPSNPTSPPPHPIPNRPLRSPNNTSTKRTPPPKPQLQNNPNNIDFLEKFKLGIENNPKGGHIISQEEKKDENEEENVIPADADEIFKKMKETGLIPNAVAMLDGLCKDGLVQEAMKLFGLMREKGSIPEVVIYTAVVEGFCKAGKFDDAIRVFRKMEGNGIEANAFSYGVLVRGLCRGRRLEDGVEFGVEMLEKGFSMNLATFVGLVEGICKEKGLEDAKRLIGTLKEKGLFYDEKAVKEYLDKKGPFPPVVWEAIVGKRASKKSGFFD